MENCTNATLIQRIGDQMDQQSWEEFTGYYSAYVYTLLKKSGIVESDLNDCRQEIFLNIWKAVKSFQYDPHKCKFRSWLAVVVRNYIINYCKRKRLNCEELNEYSLAVKQSEVENLAEVEWKLHLANLAMEKIKARFGAQALASYESIYDGHTAGDVALKYGIEENTVYVYRKRVKAAMLREIVLLRTELE